MVGLMYSWQNSVELKKIMLTYHVTVHLAFTFENICLHHDGSLMVFFVVTIITIKMTGIRGQTS